MVMIIHLYRYTQNHCIAHIKMVNFMVWEWYLRNKEKEASSLALCEKPDIFHIDLIFEQAKQSKLWPVGYQFRTSEQKSCSPLRSPLPSTPPSLSGSFYPLPGSSCTRPKASSRPSSFPASSVSVSQLCSFTDSSLSIFLSPPVPPLFFLKKYLFICRAGS